jgi:DNA-binding response OmpR family regulator
MDSSRHSRILRFGPFEVDLRSGELRRNGFTVKLQGQPFQILAMLLERPRELLTREEIRGRLWPADTFVDFDHSLNSAITRLREALGDSADNPLRRDPAPSRLSLYRSGRKAGDRGTYSEWWQRNFPQA